MKPVPVKLNYPANRVGFTERFLDASVRGLKSLAHPNKGLYYLGGLTEATETLLCFALMCVWPPWFAPIAYGFAVLCAVTIATRLVVAWRTL